RNGAHEKGMGRAGDHGADHRNVADGLADEGRLAQRGGNIGLENLGTDDRQFSDMAAVDRDVLDDRNLADSRTGRAPDPLDDMVAGDSSADAHDGPVELVARLQSLVLLTGGRRRGSEGGLRPGGGGGR